MADLFDIFDNFDNLFGDTENDTPVKERVTTLLRSSSCKELSDEQLDVYSINYSDCYKVSRSSDTYLKFVSKLSSKVFQPMLQKAGSDESTFKKIAGLVESDSFQLRFGAVEPPLGVKGIYLREGADMADIISLEIVSVGETLMTFGVTSTPQKKHRHVVLRDGTSCSVLGETLAILFILKEWETFVSKAEQMEVDISEALFKKDRPHYLSVCGHLQQLPFMEQFVAEYAAQARQKGYDVKCGTESATLVRKRNRDTVIYDGMDIVYYMVLPNLVALSKSIEVTPFTLFQRSATGAVWTGFSKPGKNRYNAGVECLSEMLCLMKEHFGVLNQVAVDQLYDRKLDKDRANRARSFETKKNTPKYLLDAAANSRFSGDFKFVEFDESISLDEMKKLEDEWSGLRKDFFSSLDLSDISLRFRRLGNHHAAGLYYRPWRCICIDVRQPDSFLHELGHCIDHKFGGLSNLLEPQFGQMHRLYKEHFEKCSDGIVLKGKYDAQYYLNHAEVFARCFEIYCKEKHIGFSLLKTEEDFANSRFAYPNDEATVQYIVQYFDDIFAEISGKAAVSA